MGEEFSGGERILGEANIFRGGLISVTFWVDDTIDAKSEKCDKVEQIIEIGTKDF